MKLTKHSSHIHTIDNFIDAKRCDEMIEWSEQKGYQKASVTTPSGPRMMSGARNNDRLIFDYKPLAEELFSTLKVFLPNVDGLSPIELNERFGFTDMVSISALNVIEMVGLIFAGKKVV